MFSAMSSRNHSANTGDTRQMEALIERPFDPARKRYYLVESDMMKSTGDINFLNREEFMTDGVYKRSHVVREFAGKDVEGGDLYYSCAGGLPKLQSKPRIKVAIRNNLSDTYGYRGQYFVSTRVKLFLEQADSEAFQFAECETITKGDVFFDPPYWMMGVIRVVRRFDEERSAYIETGGRNPNPVPIDRGAGIHRLYDIHMSKKMPEDYHAFYFLKYRSEFIWDDFIVDQWQSLKFTGMQFTPIQPASPKELKYVEKFINAEYYFEWGRDRFEGRLLP
jgi:Protein of unknown function (DUF1629)